MGLVADVWKNFSFETLAGNGDVPVGGRFWVGQNVGEQGAPPVAGKTDAARNTGPPAFPRGPEGIRENYGEVVPARRGDNFVEVWIVPPEVVEFGRALQGDVRGREAFAEALDGRHHHHGVANPVGGADENAVSGGRCGRRRHRNLWLR